MGKGLELTIVLSGYEAKPEEYASCYIRPFLNALCAANVAYLRRYPRTPKLYQSGVVYRREAIVSGRRLEEWRDIPTILTSGFGDCEDLACYRVAELRVQGVQARPVVRWRRKPDSGILYHIIVGIGNKREDPSARLGMLDGRE